MIISYKIKSNFWSFYWTHNSIVF